MQALMVLALMAQAAGDTVPAEKILPTAVQPVVLQEINDFVFIKNFAEACGRVIEGYQDKAALESVGWVQYQPDESDGVALEVSFLNGFSSGVVKSQGGTQAIEVSYFRQTVEGFAMVLAVENVTVNLRRSQTISGPRCTLYALGEYAPTALAPITEWVGRAPDLSSTSPALQSASWNALNEGKGLSFRDGDINFGHQTARQAIGPTLLGLKLQTSRLQASKEGAEK
jgi:hypothetical protein